MEGGDVGEVAVVAVEVQAVADDEFVGDFEADVIGLGGGGFGKFFLKEDAGFDGGGRLGFEEAGDGVEGLAGVEDVIDEEDVFIGDVKGGGVEDAGAEIGGGGAAVRGDGEDVDFHAQGQVTDEVGEEDDRTGEQRHEQEFAIGGVVGGDLGGELCHASLDGLAVDEDLADVLVHEVDPRVQVQGSRVQA